MALQSFYAAWYLSIAAEVALLFRLGVSRLRTRYVPLLSVLIAYLATELLALLTPYHSLLYFEVWRASQIVVVCAQAWLVLDVLRRRTACYKLLGQFGKWTSTVAAGLALVAGAASVGAIYHTAAWADPRLGWAVTMKQALSQTIAIRLAVFGVAYGFVPAEVSPNLRRYQAFLTLSLGCEAVLFLILGLSGASDSRRISIIQNVFNAVCFVGFAFVVREKDEFVTPSLPPSEAEEAEAQATIAEVRGLANRSLGSALGKPGVRGPSDQ